MVNVIPTEDKMLPSFEKEKQSRGCENIYLRVTPKNISSIV